MNYRNVMSDIPVLALCIFITACQSQNSKSTSTRVRSDHHSVELAVKARSANDSMCKATGNLAETIMEGRQNGITLSYALSLNGTEPSRGMVLRAYKQQLLFSDAGKRKTIIEFRNTEELRCQEVFN